MNRIRLTDGEYASQWGLTDLYPECEAKLRALLESGEDFETDWCGSKKELLSAQYERYRGKLYVTIQAWMDSLSDGDLIYDAAYDKFGSEDVLTDDLLDEIYDYVIDSGICSDSVYVDDALDASASYEDLMTTVDRLSNEAEEELDRMYQALCDTVEAYVNHARSAMTEP